MDGYKLTEEQAKALKGVSYDGVQFFAPVQDASGSWFIFEAEINGCTVAGFDWVKKLNLKKINPIITQK